MKQRESGTIFLVDRPRLCATSQLAPVDVGVAAPWTVRRRSELGMKLKQHSLAILDGGSAPRRGSAGLHAVAREAGWGEAGRSKQMTCYVQTLRRRPAFPGTHHFGKSCPRKFCASLVGKRSS